MMFSVAAGIPPETYQRQTIPTTNLAFYQFIVYVIIIFHILILNFFLIFYSMLLENWGNRDKILLFLFSIKQ